MNQQTVYQTVSGRLPALESDYITFINREK